MRLEKNKELIKELEQKIVELELRLEFFKKRIDLLIYKTDKKEKKLQKLNSIVDEGAK